MRHFGRGQLSTQARRQWGSNGGRQVPIAKGKCVAENGVFCLEGEWDSDLRKRWSVLPVLELLERLGELKAIHRDVATKEELAFYLKKWSQRRYDDYQILFIASHGDKGSLCWSTGNETSLEELAELIGDSARGCYIYMGSCLTLFDEKEARRFAERTGAAAVMGYRREVDMVEGAGWEVILLSWLANHYGHPATLFKQLMQRHQELAKLYKFVMVTQKEALHAAKWPERN